ncbi:phosphoenolpyruvate synthase [Candidatus Berkelbacteria bacterium]|nr:phosphoenolpyruvate synthase [Candidatus Berkelbacteria bacterium]
MAKTINIAWLEEVDKNDVVLVGGKGANLGEMIQAGLNVPPGFTVTTQAHAQFLKANELATYIEAQLTDLDPEDTKLLEERSQLIREKILTAQIPRELAHDIQEAYNQLTLRPSAGLEVAVRSSAVAEDLTENSMAGSQESFLNISGADEVVEAVRQAWASLYNARAIYYRLVFKIDQLNSLMAVTVQAMVVAEVSGVAFSVDPSHNDKSLITIEAAFGLGEVVAWGCLNPDRYILTKADLKLISKQVSKQEWQISRGDHRAKHIAVAPEHQSDQKLTDEVIVELAKQVVALENHFQLPQDVEWAWARGQLYYLQTRPVTTLKKNIPVKVGDKTAQSKATRKTLPLLEGQAASLGLKSGPVRILHQADQIDKLQPGDILVTELTSPNFVPAMKRAAAIITNMGGLNSHAAIVAREIGIPAVVGTTTATHFLEDGQVVTVDGVNGLVYKGKLDLSPREVAETPPQSRKTATNIYVNLAEPTLAAEVFKKHRPDGIGLLRAEFMIAGLGEHPKAMIKRGARAEYVTKLADGIEQFAKAFHPHPVVYRSSDFKTNEYRSLKGGDEFEPHEENPMIGYRGALRYLKDPDLFKAELEALREVRGRRGFDNVYLMIPFVRTVDQLKEVKKMVDESGLTAEPTFKLWMMVEVPSNVIMIDEFLDAGIDGVSIGTNDLTQLTLGADRDNGELEGIFDERDEAVIRSVEKVIRAANARHKTCSICGQAPSTYPEFAEMAIKAGVTSLSVNPDAIDSVRKLAASIEKNIHG